jgi:ParB family chromosome partitioning protein
VIQVDIDRIRPGRHQPRTRFDDARDAELAASIQRTGVIQPVILARDGDGYRLIAGERRWRAAQRAGLLRVPALVRDVAENRRLEVALVENLQREDLNPLEEARAYRSLVRDHKLTQAEIAARVGRSRTAVANTLRLLELPPAVQELVESGQLPMGHARALLGLEQAEDQIRLAREAVRSGLSAREVERRVGLRQTGRSSRGRPQERRDPHEIAAEESLTRALGTRVRIRRGRGKAGRVEIHFGGDEELQRIYEVLNGIVKT